MKTLLSISFLFLFLPSIFSQQYVRDDAQWVYNFSGAFSYGYTIITYEQDTLIGGRQVKQFGRYHTQVFPGFPDTLERRNGPIFFYENQGIVEYSISGTQFYPRLDFNLEFGDTVQVINFYPRNDTLNIPYGTMFITVSDTFSLDVGSESLFSREIEYKTVYYDGRNDRLYIDTLVPYLGLLNQYIDPADAFERAVDGGEGGFLRCYKNDDLGIVQSPIRGNIGPLKYDCGKFSAVTSSKPSIDPKLISFYPNPVVDFWEIDYAGNEALDAKLIDVNGRKLFQFQLKPGKNELSIGQLPAGLYFLMIEGKAVEKVLKQ